MSFNRSSGDRSQRVDLGDRTLVRYNYHGKRFELVVDPERAWLLRQGEDVQIEDIVERYIFFENFSKGLKANNDELQEIFGTENDKEIAKQMILKGELQLTQEQRKQFLAEKRAEIIDYLVIHAVNPKTKAPHPASRIEKAMDDAGVRIDRKEPAADQALRIIKEIQNILPIQIESASIEFIVPAKDTGKMYGFLKSSGDVIKEDWSNDGSLSIIVKVPAGKVAILLEKVSDESKGRIRSVVIDRAG